MHAENVVFFKVTTELGLYVISHSSIIQKVGKQRIFSFKQQTNAVKFALVFHT